MKANLPKSGFCWEDEFVFKQVSVIILTQMENKKSIAMRKVRPGGLKVTVVVPTYNEEAIIGRTVRNLKQILPAGTEIIVAEGYSKDYTALIARKLKAHVVLEKEHTVGGARNAGATAAKGADIVWFVDADTFPTVDFYNRMLAVFEDDPKVVGVGCHIMPEDIGILRQVFFYFLNMFVYFTVRSGKPNIAGSCVAYRKKAFEAIGGFDTETHSAEDMDLTKRIAKHGKVVFLYHVVVPTSDRRVHKLGLWGLIKDWTKTTVWYLQGKKTASYGAYR